MITQTHTPPNLRPIETRLVLELFETSPGYILDFNNNTFAEFFSLEVGIDIYDEIYADLGSSKGKRFRTFLRKGRAEAVAKALAALWEYRAAMLRRQGDQDLVPNGMEDLSQIVERMGGAPLFASRPAKTKVSVPDEQTWSTLAHEFTVLRDLDPQPRGYAFERFLNRLFEACKLEPREAFRLRGEQIDGSFQLVDTYLLEARWRNEQSDAAALRSFQGKVEDRPVWARGLFVSYSGFSSDGLAAFGARRILLMDGLASTTRWNGESPSTRLSRQRPAGRPKQPAQFVRVRDLF
jgi:hypothetical protein